MLVPTDDKNGYLVDEHVLRMYASSNGKVMSLGDGTPGSHNDFIKFVVKDYIRIYRELERLGEL